MRVFASLLAATVLLVGSTLSAHADTYEFLVTNFDGFGSSATFDLPSSEVVARNQYGQDNQLVTGTTINLIFEPGASIPPYFPDIFAATPISNVHYEQVPLKIGFDDRLAYELAVGAGIDEGDFNIYDGYPLFLILLGPDAPPLFTVEDGLATFKLGTFGNVTIVNATPEPSTLVLLGTGVLGLAGLARRRFLAAS
jgi:PEP-CTERM motif